MYHYNIYLCFERIIKYHRVRDEIYFFCLGPSVKESQPKTVACKKGEGWGEGCLKRMQ